MNNNLELWERVQKTDPKHTKKAKVSGMSITAVAPQYQIKNATREFGTYGVDWGFKSIELDYSLIDKYDLIVFKGTFFTPKGSFQIINSSKMFMDRKKEMIDADFAKKIETDALTKALSKMGFNADIFMGRYDDTKYINEMKKEFKEVDVLPDVKESNIDAAIAGGFTLDQLQSKYKVSEEMFNYFIKNYFISECRIAKLTDHQKQFNLIFKL